MYKIRLITNRVNLIMPEEHDNLFTACKRADLYKGKNRAATFQVYNAKTGDIEYEV